MLESGEPRRKRFIWFLLALLLLVGVVVRVGHWHPGFGSDDSRYMNLAATMARGETLTLVDHAAVRLAFEAYLAAAMSLFGTNSTVCAAMGLFTFVGTGILLFLVTGRLSCDGAALVAVFLYLFVPLDIVNSTAVLPDSLMAMLAMAATFCYLAAVDEIRGGRQFLLALCSGLLLGLAMSAKEPAFCVGVALAIHLVLVVRDRRTCMAVLSAMALGTACVFLLELVGFWLWTFDAFYRFHTLAGVYGKEGFWENQLNARNAAMYLILGSDSWDAFGIHFHVFFLAILAGWNRRTRAMIFPLIWCGVLALFLSVGSSSLTRYVLVPQHARYFLPVMVMGCAAAGIGLYELGRAVTLKRTTIAAAAAVFALLSLWAARRQTPPGIVPLAEQLTRLEAAGRQVPIVPASFVQRQALENRSMVGEFEAIDDDAILADRITAEELAGPGLLVPDLDGYRGQGSIEERIQARFPSRLGVEEVLGPGWPPYDRWFGTGPNRRPVGRIWRLKPAPR